MNATKQIRTLQGLLTLLAMATVLTAYPASAQEATEATDVWAQASTDRSTRNYGVLHVNAATGSDRLGAGSAEQPYQTITHALQQTSSSASTVILLAPGHYSQETGEQFPLRLRPGVTIQGNAGATRDTLIVGGGEFQARGTGQNATIVTSDRSGLANVLVSNPRGSGVWIVTGAPILRRVALVANAAAGIQVTAGAPVIENSYFNRNQSGLVIHNGRATVRGNLFEATGHAITVTSPAVPTINNNRIAGNEVGIALKNNARPALAANVLNDNGRNGVVEVESVDVAASPTTADQTVVTAPMASEPDSAAAAERTVSTDVSTSASERLVTLPTPAAAPVMQQRPAQRQPVAPDPGALADGDSAVVDGDAISIAVIPAGGQAPESTRDPGDEKSEGISKLLARLNQRPSTVPSRVESPAGTGSDSENIESETIENVERLGGTGQRLPVPSAAIPGGNDAASLSPPGTVSLANSFRYRVLVNMADADDLWRLVPDAFRTQVGNEMFMQAGAYVDENEAQERLDWLQANGIDGRVNIRE
ncbi:MAG: DUF1565 domain-containing protein [Cyanobacteria bacterium P01_H01_bin.26]